MTVNGSSRRMILCAGLQSSGSTLFSWCFLQRRDTNGALDMPNDIIRTSFEKVTEPILWVKMTVGAFRWLDVHETYRDMGWRPEPLLFVRDVRATYASLMKKSFGANGNTAEDPPLRVRFRRFLSDWELFRERGWPIVRFEDFIEDECAVLMRICRDLSLDWDRGMISWPKQLSEIVYVDAIQKTFERSLAKGSLPAAKLSGKIQIRIENLPQSELEWLEETFAAFNRFHGYPDRVYHPAGGEAPARMTGPGFEGTAREWYYSEQERLRAENESLRCENDELRHEHERLRRENERLVPGTAARSRAPAPAGENR
jgi:hypothetical protein